LGLKVDNRFAAVAYDNGGGGGTKPTGSVSSPNKKTNIAPNNPSPTVSPTIFDDGGSSGISTPSHMDRNGGGATTVNNTTSNSPSSTVSDYVDHVQAVNQQQYDLNNRILDEHIGFVSNALDMLGGAFLNILDAVHSALIFELGVGAGIGVSINTDVVSASAISKNDFISIKKDAGSYVPKMGMSVEEYAGFEAMGCEFYQGYKKFYNFDGNSPERENLYPDFNINESVNASVYFMAGATLEIGFDIINFIEKLFD
jgi:hypothetical protein